VTASRAALVIDASVAVKWVLEEPGSDWARALPATGAHLVAPNLLCTECGNVLWRMVRTKRIGASLLEGFWSVINAVPLALCDADWGLNAAALRLSVRLDHPIYDCLYLAVALDRGAALATADQRFLRALRRAAVLPLDRLLAPPEAAA
jgi:predicted nucleic acid-binding protein